MQARPNDIIAFIIVVSMLILALIIFIVFIVNLYRKKQISFVQRLEQIKLDHENNLLITQLEIQEQTFLNISREIHDNICLALTLAKLHLNTIDWKNRMQTIEKVDLSIDILGQSITDLSDISKSLNADLIRQNGLTKALEDEIQLIRDTGLYEINCDISGDLTYMDAQRELVIFRMVQEAFNNIIKHARANKISLKMNYDDTNLYISIKDDGIGFDTVKAAVKGRAGLKNMQTRAKMLQGTMDITSIPAQGTSLTFIIPYE